MSEKTASVFIGLLTIVIYLLTTNPDFNPIITSFFIFYLIASILLFGYFSIIHKKNNNIITNIIIFFISVTVMLWVGVTGWFFSPFYYLLFLLAISYGFLFSPVVTLVFIVILSVFYYPNLGSIDNMLDYIMLISLYLIIPLTYYLQKQYLILQQAQKKVLLLQEKHEQSNNIINNLLSNKITRLMINIRQPVSNIKQIAIFSQKVKGKSEIHSKFDSIINLTDTILKQINNFEEISTGKKLIK